MTERTITFPDDLKPKWVDRFVADVQAHLRGVQAGNETYPAPHHGWICFHCGERFTTKEGAAIHFGTVNDDRPDCIEQLAAKNRELVMTLESVKHGAEYPDEVGDMIDDALRPLSSGQRHPE